MDNDLKNKEDKDCVPLRFTPKETVCPFCTTLLEEARAATTNATVYGKSFLKKGMLCDVTLCVTALLFSMFVYSVDVYPCICI